MKNMFRKHRYLYGTLIFAMLIIVTIYGVFSLDNANNRMVVEYVTNLGWQVNPSPVEITHLTIPYEFDAVFETYNAVQKKSGFDLDNFRGKRVVRYTYQLQNHIHSGDSRVYLGVLVYESRIIAAEIYSTDINGFMHGVVDVENINKQ